MAESDEELVLSPETQAALQQFYKEREEVTRAESFQEDWVNHCWATFRRNLLKLISVPVSSIFSWVFSLSVVYVIRE